MKLFLLLLTCQVLSAAPLDDRLSIQLEAGAAFRIDGHTRLRQHDTPGDRLGFRHDLGVDNWFRVGLDATWRVAPGHAVSAGFTLNRFRGQQSLGRAVTHEGATFATGTELRFDRSTWWRIESWYQYTAWHGEHAALTLLGGLLMDFADIYVQADPGPVSGERDDHENFGRYAVPLPALGARLQVTPLPAFSIAAQARGTWVENLPTWYGRIRHSQTAFDARVEVSYLAGPVEFGLAVHHTTLHLEQTDKANGNEFAANATLVQLFAVIRL